MKIRDSVATDGDAIRSVVTDALAEFGFPVESSGIDADLDDIQASYQDRGGIFLVLVDDNDAVVGCGGIYPVDAKLAELRKMYFRPTTRGLGFGRRLLSDLVDRAKEKGFERIVLETASNLTAAIRLYESFGFIESKGPKHSCRCDRTFALPLN